MRYSLALLAIFILTASVSAIRINEVETNPAGTDAGNEWIELYNNDEILLDGYEIINGDGKNISLNGSFEGYFVYTFAKQWLDNSNESIFLYKDSELIDKITQLDDSKNNDLTYQICDSSWMFLNSTKGEENICPEGINDSDNQATSSDGTDLEEENETTTSESQDNSHHSSVKSKTEAIKSQGEETDLITPKVISLTPSRNNTKDIKTNSNDFLTTDNLAIFGLAGFCILLGILFALGKIKKPRTEFDNFGAANEGRKTEDTRNDDS